MALREGECFLVRRFAARGIDKNIGDSRAHDDRFNRDRRFAARGNEIGNRDPWDFEIKRLRRRVLDLEASRLTCKETELGGSVSNDSTREEEDLTEGDHIYHVPPVFDDYEKVSSGMFNFFNKIAAINGDAVANDGDTEVTGGDECPARSHAKFSDEPKIYGYLDFSKYKDNDNIVVTNNMGVNSDNYDKSLCGLTNAMLLEIQNGIYARLIPKENDACGKKINKDNGSVDPSSILSNIEHDVIGDFNSIHTDGKKNKGDGPKSNSTGVANKVGFEFNFSTYEDNKGGNDIFDPGGEGTELGETILKVELFRWVVMIMINTNRVDVPFDPGGFDPKAKLEDEFFRRGGV